MFTTKKILLALGVAAGLTMASSALAGDVSSDRHFKEAPLPVRHEAAAGQQAAAQPGGEKKVDTRVAQACACAHKS